MDPGPCLETLVDAKRLAVRGESYARFSVPAEEQYGPSVADLELVFLELGEGQDRRSFHAENLGSDGGRFRRQYESDVLFVLSRKEHSAALDSPELGWLEVREDDDLPSPELLGRVILPDSRNDLPSLLSQVHLEHVQLVRVRMLFHVDDARDPDIEAGRGIHRVPFQLDLGEERLADSELLTCRDVLGRIVPSGGVDIRVVSERVPQPRRTERQERSHEEGQRPRDPARDVDGGRAGRPIGLHEVPGRLLIDVLVSEAGKLDRLLHRVLQVHELEVLADLLALL